jgi:hypothetical protein
MSRGALIFGGLVLGAGVLGYHVLVKPQLTSAVDSIAPALSDAAASAQSLKSSAEEAVNAAMDSPLGTKVSELWNARQPFFDPMSTPPPQAAPSPLPGAPF